MQELTFEQVEEVNGGVDWGHIAEGAATGALSTATVGLRSCAPAMGSGGAGYALCVGGFALAGAASGAVSAGLWQSIKNFFSSDDE
jgi:hypothetical protein